MQWTKRNYTLLPQGEAEPLTPGQAQRRAWNRRRIWQWIIPALLATVVIVSLVVIHAKGGDDSQPSHGTGPACPQFPVFKESDGKRGELERDVKEAIGSDEFFEKSLKRMQGAVQIPTESFDHMGKVGEDERWNIFKEFHEYLEKTFPLV